MTVELIQGLLLSFAIVVILMPPYIRLLRETGFTKQIRIEGPDSHQIKHGTPTMGGALIIVVVVALYLLLGRPPEGGIYAPLAALAGVGLLGAFDDYLNAKTGQGIRIRQKLIWQVVFAVAAAFLIQRTYQIDQIAVPFVGPVFVDPAIYVTFAAFAIIAASNGVNITDGLDGLAGGTLVFAFVAFLLVAILNVPSQPNLAFLCALIIGALLGFLWFNVHPAQIFMGDSGLPVAGGDARGHRPDHGPDPRAAADRADLRHRNGVGHRPDRVLQAEWREADLPDGTAPPPLRAGRLGRGEDHAPLLDRRDPVGPARRDAVPGLDQEARVSPAMTIRPIDLEALTLDGIRHGTLRGVPVTVLGFARSGIALARFFADAGADVTIYDGRPIDELAGAVDALDGRPARILAGPDIAPETAWEDAALVATSPSINPDYPTTEPRLRDALRWLVGRRSLGDATVPALVSEADLFLRLCPAPTIGVTGTKGKTTTSSLIAAILAADADHPVVLGGNIGVPLVERLPELSAEHRVVIELSELQLPTLSRGTTVAVYTNVTSDHLDRHGTLERYRAVKQRLAELVDPRGALVLNGDDPIVASYADIGSARRTVYRFGRPAAGGVGVVDDWIIDAGVQRLTPPLVPDGSHSPAGRIMPIGELSIPGRHNVSNALAAVAVGRLFGVAPEAIRLAATAFTGVEHRLEPVAIVDGVRFVNDSQGTQPDAVVAALLAFERPIVLIAGGRDKGVDLSALGPVVVARAAAAVLIGESGPELQRLFRDWGLAHTRRAMSIDEAVRIADGLARARLAAGDPAPATVLLSPAAASFDMFADYAARGRAFKDAVGRLATERQREAQQ